MAEELIVSYLSDPEIVDFDVCEKYPEFPINSNISCTFSGVLVCAPAVWLATVTNNHPLLFYLVEHNADLTLQPESIDVVDEDLDTCANMYYTSCMSILLKQPWLLDCVYQLGVKPTVHDLEELVRLHTPKTVETLLVMLAYDSELVTSTLIQIPISRVSQGQRAIIGANFQVLPVEAFMLFIEFGIGKKLGGCTESNEKAIAVLKYYGSRPSEERLEAVRRYKRSRE